MEKKTVILVIVGLFVLAFTFILMAIFVSEHKLKQKQFLLPDVLNSSTCPPDFNPLPVILVSLDGFRPGYMSREMNPVLQKLIENGASTPYMATSYPSITFPNHYTIVTGLYPESHGILRNSFLDKETGEYFSLKSKTSKDSKWWRGEPIWNTVTKNGYKSGVYFWAGSEAPIGGMFPTYYKKYNKSVPLNDRVDQALQWLKLPAEERPVFISLYTNQPDSAGHRYGPSSKEVDSNLTVVDNMIRRLIQGLKDQDILHCVNIIVISDHGMAASGKDKTINLAHLLGQLSGKVTYSNGASAGLSLKKIYQDQKTNLENSLVCKEKKIRVFKKDELPLRLHFTRDKNIHDYVILPEDGYSVVMNPTYFLKGLHGYDSHTKSMNALFFAYGPSFKAGTITEPFQNIEIYNLLCHLLGISPAPNNGTEGRLYDILKEPPLLPRSIEGNEYPAFTETKPERYSTSNCKGDRQYNKDLLDMISLIDEEIKNISLRILPWGTPQRGTPSLDTGLLYHPEHVTAYSKVLKLPMWSSFVIDSLPSSPKIQEFHWRSDFRIDQSAAPSCPEIERKFTVLSNYTIYPLYPTEFSKDNSLASLVTNALPFSINSLGHWKQFLLDTLPKRLMFSKSPIHVIVGPIFDRNSDGLDDYSQSYSKLTDALPTDFFAVATRCNAKVTDLEDCSYSDLDAIAFVLPQTITISNCQSPEEIALEYNAKVRDVEIVTGMKFFPKIPTQQRLKLILREHQEMWPLIN